MKEATLIREPKLFGRRLKQHRLFILRSEFLLTLDITPGFILQDMVGVVHIGKAAKLAGVSVDTIRFYQRLGLIKSAGRSAGGYRLFDGEQIRDLTFVRHAQELGFSLTEVKELMPLRRKHHVCSEVQSMLNHIGSGACRRAPQLQSRTAPKTGNQARGLLSAAHEP